MATPDQVHQGLAGSGLVERVAEKAGVSPQVAEIAMATILPMVISHFTEEWTDRTSTERIRRYNLTDPRTIPLTARDYRRI